MLNHDENLNTAIRYAAQLVVREDFLNSYQTAQLQKDTAPVEAIGGILSKIGAVTGDKDLMESELVMRRNILANAKRLEVTPEKWAIDFQTIAKRPKALQLFERALVIARTGIAKARPTCATPCPTSQTFPRSVQQRTGARANTWSPIPSRRDGWRYCCSHLVGQLEPTQGRPFRPMSGTRGLFSGLSLSEPGLRVTARWSADCWFRQTQSSSQI